ncbi:MAG: O-antigen ligase family protein [Terracidiphilus sp.]|jgi:O-antigen ligase
MGFVLSILYFVTYYLTPTTVFGPLAFFRIELILAVLVILVSIPTLAKSFVLRSPQSLALIGMALAVFLSVLIGGHWAGGAVSGFLLFVPNAFAYLLVCLHFRSKKRLQILVLMMLFVCMFVIARGYIDLLRGVPGTAEITVGNTQSPYLLAQQSDAGEWIFRLRGLGEINDPNDFAQLIVCLIPLMFIFWRAKKMLLNGLFVILPVCVLLFGAFLTHSRGSLVAIMAMAVVAARRRIGALPSLLLAGVLFAAASALHFTGGREISADSGADRTGLWGVGLQLLKSHPVFGVGYGRFVDDCDCGHTAHNSIVVCAAELGLFGLYFWSLFLFPTLRDALTIASPKKVSDGEPIVAEIGLYPQAPKSIEMLDKAEINHLGRLVLLSLTGFLVAGLFLSRAYVLTLFLLGGVAEAVFEMALQRGMVAPRMKFLRVAAYSGALAVALVVIMYIMVLVLNRMH